MLRTIFILALLLSLCLVVAGQIRVSDPNPIIHKLSLSNVHAITPAEQQRIARDVLKGTASGFHQNESEFFDEIAERIRREFQSLGYFKVLVNQPLVRVLGKNGERKIVDVDINVNEGEQYWLKEIRFTANSQSSAAELRAAFPIRDGDIFDRTKIGAGLEGLRQNYAQKGYVDFSAVPETEIDEAAHSISLNIDIDEGSVFHMGALTVLGMESEPGARDKLVSTWNSYQGKVFDPRLLQQFLRDVGARPTVKPEQILRISFDQQAKAANVSMTLVNPFSF